MFMPIGWLFILLIPVLFFLITRAVVRKVFQNNKVYVLCVTAFVVGAVCAVLIINANYYVNYTNLLKEIP